MERAPDSGGVRRRQRALLVAGLLLAPFTLLDLLLPDGRAEAAGPATGTDP